MHGVWVDRDFNPIDPPKMEMVLHPSAPGMQAPPQDAYLLVEGAVPLWLGAQERGDTGLTAFSGVHALLAWELRSLPDFSSSRFPDLAGLEAAQRVAAAAQQQAQFLSSLHQSPYLGISLRYQTERTAAGDLRLRLMLVLRVSSGTREEALRDARRVVQLVESTTPRGYRFQPCHPEVILDKATGYAEIIKVEQWENAWHDPERTGFRFWYGVQGFAANGANDMVGFCQALVRLPSPVIVDVTLTPTLPLTGIEREELQTWGHIADRYSRDRRESLEEGGGLYSQPSRRQIEIQADPKAEGFKRLYEGLLEQYDRSQERPFLYSIRVLPLTSEIGAGAAARTLAAFALQPGAPMGVLSPMPGSAEFDKAIRSVSLSYVTPAICEDKWSLSDAPETLRRLHRMTMVAEVSAFFRMPIAGKEGCPGFAQDSGLDAPGKENRASKQGLTVGRFVEHGRELQETASVVLPDLSKHALIVGVPGSGKTSLSFSLLVQLWRDAGVPWLVLEPAKTEYRGLLEVSGVGEDLLVFTVGNERIAPLRLNPLEIMEGVAVSEHIASLKACFQGAFSLPDPLPMLFETALEEVYTDKGWSLFGEGGDDSALEPPTLLDLYHKALDVAARSKYQGEVAGNIKAALETRLGSLLKGPKGRCFGARKSVPIELLMSRPVVLELDSLSEEEKALTMMVLLVFVRERAVTTRRSGAPLTHVCLVEEAHNLLGASTTPKEGADPKGIAVRFFVRMLAEMRALGEGLIIADQLPTALAPEAVKNTNVKIMHRLTAADDREVLGRTMVLTDGQIEQAALLPAGMSLVFQEGWPAARLVREPDIKAELGIAEPPDRSFVRERMEGFFGSSQEVLDAYLPYKSCHEVCRRCDPLIRERRERWAAARLPIIEQELRRDPNREPEVVALIEYGADIELPPDAAIESACAMVHFLEVVEPWAKRVKVSFP